MSQLKIKNLSVEADGKEVVHSASLSVAGGDVHVLMGPNGSGKSSFVNGVFGHPKYKRTTGTINLDGEDITESPIHEKAQKGLFLSMQYMPEIEGVRLSQFLYQAYKKTGNNEMSVLDFQKFLSEKADMLDISSDFLKRPLSAGLSGGEKKQSEILQLFVLEPRFAFLDEIDSGVDVDSLKKVLKGIELLKKKGTGFVLITHYTSLLKKITPDKIHVMKEGKIIESGGSELAQKIEESGFQ